jgi:hypothetical protein
MMRLLGVKRLEEIEAADSDIGIWQELSSLIYPAMQFVSCDETTYFGLRAVDLVLTAC